MVRQVANVEGAGETALARSEPPVSLTTIKIASRVGVWGFIGGFAPVIAFTLGLPVSIPLMIDLLAAGLVIGGAGTTIASWTIRSRISLTGSRLLRTAATLGAPLGLVLAGTGIATLLEWQVVSAAGGIAMSALGLTVVVLLLAAFFMNWNDEDDGVT